MKVFSMLITLLFSPMLVASMSSSNLESNRSEIDGIIKYADKNQAAAQSAYIRAQWQAKVLVAASTKGNGNFNLASLKGCKESQVDGIDFLEKAGILEEFIHVAGEIRKVYNDVRILNDMLGTKVCKTEEPIDGIVNGSYSIDEEGKTTRPMIFLENLKRLDGKATDYVAFNHESDLYRERDKDFLLWVMVKEMLLNYRFKSNLLIENAQIKDVSDSFRAYLEKRMTKEQLEKSADENFFPTFNQEK